jgi:hypothetical protein
MFNILLYFCVNKIKTIKMKALIISITICLFLCECKHEDYVPDCVCSNLDSYTGMPPEYYGTQEGVIIFPKYPNLNYFVWAKKDFTRYANGKQYHQLCTDSSLIKQIRDKQIKDSSEIIMTGVSAFITGICNVNYQRTWINVGDGVEFAAPNLRIKSIDKK